MNSLKSSVVSAITRLRFWPLSTVRRFDISYNLATMQTLGFPVEIHITPGTPARSHSMQGGMVDKKITFSTPSGDPDVVNTLEILRHTPLIVEYVDPFGRPMVCGSISYPLMLTFNHDGGSILATLTGRSTMSDLYLNLS